MNMKYMIIVVSLLLVTVCHASDAERSVTSSPSKSETIDLIFKSILNAPPWEYYSFEAGKDRELLIQLMKLGPLSSEDIKTVVSRLMQSADKAPTRNTWFKVYVINRLVFDLPQNTTWRDTPGVFGGFGHPVGVEEATWPLLFFKGNKLRISSRSEGYSGPEYRGLQEFDAFAARYDRRDISIFTAVDPMLSGDPR